MMLYPAPFLGLTGGPLLRPTPSHTMAALSMRTPLDVTPARVWDSGVMAGSDAWEAAQRQLHAALPGTTTSNEVRIDRSVIERATQLLEEQMGQTAATSEVASPPGELLEDLKARFEDATGFDLDGDGHVGKPPVEIEHEDEDEDEDDEDDGVRDILQDVDRVQDIIALRVVLTPAADAVALLGAQMGRPDLSEAEAEALLCHIALKNVRRLPIWQEVPGRVKDFVRHPKPNGYQSIHTNLRLPDGRLVEVQLRTRQMHERAERGSAAHHLYKGGADNEAGKRELGTAATRAVAALLPAAESKVN